MGVAGGKAAALAILGVKTKVINNPTVSIIMVVSPFGVGKKLFSAARQIVERIGPSKLPTSPSTEEIKVWKDGKFFPLAMGQGGFIREWRILDGRVCGGELGEDSAEIWATHWS